MPHQTDYPIGHPSAEDEPPDLLTLQAVKDIFIILGRSVSALKLFPDNNDMVIRFRQDFVSQLLTFLKNHDELDVEIRQNAFLYRGKPIFQDENVTRSLPYLFFKDGMKKLTFLQGIYAEEIVEFLGVIRAVSLLPLEVSDSVDALWKKDFANIQFFAPDDFLESKITVDHKIPLQFQIHKEELFRGRIDLQPEDVAEMFKARRGQTDGSGQTDSGSMDRFAALDESDLQRLESLLGDERLAFEEKDFVDLVFELLHIEDRPDAFVEVLKYLAGHHAVQIQNLDFIHAAQLLRKMEPLSRKLAGAAPEKIKAFEQFRDDLGKKCPWAEIRKAAVERRIPELNHLFEYLSLLGPAAIPLGAELYEDAKDKETRTLAQGFLEEMGRIDSRILAEQARETRPVITKVIIGILGQLRDPKTIPFLAGFLNYQDKSIKLRAIRALGGFSEEKAHQILIKFLHDPDKEVRIEAASHIRIGHDPELIRELIRLAADKGFHKKNEAETTSILLALGKSLSEEACAFLVTLLKKSVLLGRSKLHATQLGAVRALAAHGGPAAVEALEAGARKGKRKLRPACREALERLASNPTAGRRTIP